MVMSRIEGLPFLRRSTLDQLPEWLSVARSVGAFILLDKPRYWSSFDTVRFLRRLLGLRRIGHAGTLDPLATGLLILGIGRATRLLPTFQRMPKTYVTRMKLGAITATDDAEAPEQPICSELTVTEAEFRQLLERFRGTIEQVPPQYSAVHHGGKRLYELARAGISVSPLPRTVHIAELELTRWEPPFAELFTVCSTGTYVRALVRDLGAAAGCGAYVVELRRLAIGPYHVDDAVSPDELSQAIAQQHARLHPLV